MLASPERDTHVVFYDGVCGLCNRLVRFAVRHDAAGRFRFASLQSHFARRALEGHEPDPRDLSSIYVLAHHETAAQTLLRKARAVLFMLETLGRLRFLTAIAARLPTRLLDLGYDTLARHRYRFFGRYDACPLPSAEERDRFIEV